MASTRFIKITIKDGYRSRDELTWSKFSFPMKCKTLVIKPYIGFERHETPMDTEYGKNTINPYETYNTVGLRVKW
ncbi:MAG: hypothetical protein H7281_16765 [Bacteriovorax sp.]|nr:hypothetical protein [Bacteriovorax sp.]